jgi:uncharacterized membrane protein
MQNRFRSKTAWIAVISLALFVTKNYTGIEIAEVDRLVELILVTLTALGVFNNPTDKENY